MARRASRRPWIAAPVLLVLAGSTAPESTSTDPVPALRELRAAWKDGDAERALAQLARLERGPLADHAYLLRARLLRESGNLGAALEAAVAALAQEPPSEVRSRIAREMAQIQLAREDLVAALRAQQSAWTSTRNEETAAELAAEFARIFEARGLPGDALRLYRHIWQTWPRSAGSADAFARAQFLAEATGASPAEPMELAVYADSLRTTYHCDMALEVYAGVLARQAVKASTRRRAQRGTADCLFQIRRYAEAAQAYQRLAIGDPEDVDLAIRAARSQARAGATREAVAALTAIARRGPPAVRARAQYLVAVVLREREPETSRRLLRRVERQTASAGYARLARWRLAWHDLGSGRYESAVRRLKPLTRGSPWDVEVQRALYWTAVATLRLDEPAGREALLELTKKIPLSYYGLLAADRLGVAPEIERPFLGDAEEDRPFEAERRTTWLLEGGFPDAARAELESWFRSGRLTRAERVAAASLLHSVGDHFRAVRLLVDGFGGALEQGIDPEWRDAWHHAWPQPFGLSVRAAVQEFEFDPALVYAVMREESTYRPEVVSPAGALGLMQIVPPTGTRIANRLGVPGFAPDALFDPDTNIRFGTFYLKDLMRRFEGSRPLAIAAYNAGPDVVSTWLSNSGPVPEDTFVDSVPYSETRRYLRKVIRSYRVYQLLYAPEAGRPAGSAPQPGDAANR